MRRRSRTLLEVKQRNISAPKKEKKGVRVCVGGDVQGNSASAADLFEHNLTI